MLVFWLLRFRPSEAFLVEHEPRIAAIFIE
jgi:hypothetical protein